MAPSPQRPDSIVKFVKHGTYPENEATLSSPLEASDLLEARQGLKEAREEAEARIKSISRQVGPDVDGWIQRAKQLQADIEHSRAVAREIVGEAEQTKNKRNSHNDAARKVDLLRGETCYHDDLRTTLRDMRTARDYLGGAKTAVMKGQTQEAYLIIQRLEQILPTLGVKGNASAADLLHQRAEEVKASLFEQVRALMKRFIRVDRSQAKVLITQNIEISCGNEIGIQDATELAASLGLLDTEISRIKKDVEVAIISPILATGTFSASHTCVQISDDELSLSNPSSQQQFRNLTEDLTQVVKYLHQQLPPSIRHLLAENLMPSITAHLVSHNLPSALPTDVDDLAILETLSDSIHGFADALDKLSWSGGADLREWNNNVAKTWLAKKREKSIDTTRILLSKRLNHRSRVEHVETQVVTSEDAIAQTSQAEDWDEDWGEENEDQEKTAPSNSARPTGDDDWGAWDPDEEQTDKQANALPELGQPNGQAADGSQSEDDEGADDWGWDDQKPADAPPSPAKAGKSPPQANGHPQSVKKERELTLRENYTVTGLPDGLFDTIGVLVDEARRLRVPPLSSTPVAAAANGLYSIPTFSIAAYRALAPAYYELLIGGNMLLYNDSMRLASRLKELEASLDPSDPASSRLKLDVDVPSLEGFGRRAYSKAMDEQRTIVRDFIDNAQGFANCTTSPYKQECDNAVQMTVAHIRSTAGQWANILSRSAWFQSLGSLVSTIIGKVILDVEEMGDIGAEESTQLRQFCLDVGKLSDLFVQEDAQGSRQEVVGVYVGQWFKFQYLIEVLESNLEDMKYLWREGGLAEEFEMEEVVELMQALFADGDRRRRAIAEIKRT